MTMTKIPPALADFTLFDPEKNRGDASMRNKEGCVVAYQPSSGRYYQVSTASIGHFISNTKCLLRKKTHTSKVFSQAYAEDRNFLWLYKVIKTPEAILERQREIETALTPELRLNAKLRIRIPTKW